jgi:recombination protein RecA
MSDTPALPVARSDALRTRGNDNRPGLESPTPPPHPGETGPAPFALENLSGRLVELSSFGNGAPLSFAAGLILEAQLSGEPAAWIACGQSSFYPPDFARSGIDLDALPVLRVPDAASAARAADKLVRSGAFGLVVLDLIGSGGARGQNNVPSPLQSRLLALASRHATAIVFLTEKTSEAPSLGSLVSLRAQTRRRRLQEGRYSCDVEILKDKRHGPRTHSWAGSGDSSTSGLCSGLCNGPAGLH